MKQADAVEVIRSLLEKEVLSKSERSLLEENLHVLRQRLKRARALLPGIDIGLSPHVESFLSDNTCNGVDEPKILEHAP